MSERIVSLLGELSEAISNEEFDRARGIVATLQEVYQSRRADEVGRVTDARILFADPETASLETIDELQDMTLIDAGTRLTRSLLLIVVPGLIASYEELEQDGELEPVVDAVQTSIQELQESERELTAVSTEVDEIIESETDGPTAPRTLFIAAASITDENVGVGEKTTLSVTITNAGETPVILGELRLDPSADVSVDDETITIYYLEPGNTVTKETNVSGSRRGRHTIELTLRSVNTDTTRETVVLQVGF